MNDVRERHPRHIPCLFHMPDKIKLKLLVPMESNMSWALGEARRRWTGQVEATDALFAFQGSRMCTGTMRISAMDNQKPSPVVFHVHRECTFG